jgi:DNA-directed RNA polymerase specialized sigma24 family protein
MRPSAEPENLRWAKEMVRPFAREFREHRSDIEAEAVLGLVRAEMHKDCPAGDEFQAFAYSFIKRAVTDFTRRLRRQRPVFQAMGPDVDVIGPNREPTIDEWAEARILFAERLSGLERRIFLRAYGEDVHRSLRQVADDLGEDYSKVKRHHALAIRVLRSLQMVA